MRFLYALAALLVAAIPALAEEFFFPHVGMEVTSLDHWEVVSGQEFVAINAGNSFGDDDVQKTLNSAEGTPFFSMLSPVRGDSGVRAGFNAFSFDGVIDDIDAAAQRMQDSILSGFHDAKLIRAHRPALLNGEPATLLAVEYRIDRGDGVSNHIYEELWLIPRATNYVTISYGTLANDRDGAIWRDMRETLNSVTWRQ